MVGPVKFLIFLLGIFACQAAYLNVYLTSLDDFVRTPLEEPTAIQPYLNSSRPTVIYAFGIDGNSTATSVVVVLTALLKTNRYNVVLLDWAQEAKNVFVVQPISYAGYNVPNAEVIGCKLGKAIVTLVKNGLDISSLFLMAHSLGAQLVGNAGRCTKKEGYTIPKIIGLDPAGPAYTSILPILPALDTSCALYVAIVHTDPQGLSSPKATGHVDFYPNYSKTYTMQPGCTQRANPFNINNETACSHNYSWRLISASLENPQYFPAEFASSGDAWLAGLGDPQNIAYISVDPTPGASGTYYCRTVKDYPYSLGIDGINPA